MRCQGNRRSSTPGIGAGEELLCWSDTTEHARFHAEVAALARGCWVLVSSHLLSEVERTCDRIAIIDEGRVVASGRLEELLQADESLEDAFVRLVRS